MAVGDHWEWRGFGTLAPEARARIEALPLKFPRPQAITDEYLWIPGVRVNVKIRRQDSSEMLKLKRFLEESGGIERWLEDPAETYPFPLEPGAMQALLAALGLSGGGPATAARDAAGAFAAVRRFAPAAGRVAVEKKRWQRTWGSEGGKEGAVIIEIAEVLSPERITSVAIEDPDRGAVEAARSALGLPAGLRRLNYIDAVGLWARGETIAGGA
jgi:hypothetical protein